MVPDVAYLSGEPLENSSRRIEIYLACGAELIVPIDPRAEDAWLVDASACRRLTRDDVIEHAALPEFNLPLKRCFDRVPPGGLRHA